MAEKLSQFNFTTTHPASGDTLVFNTASGGLIALGGGAGDELQHLIEGSLGVAELSDDLAATLREQGFLVDQHVDEVGLVLERVALGIADTNRLDVFILPNMNCNFACPYCYEDHRPSQMSAEVEERLVSWFRSVAPKFKVVLVSWFGGEPLLSFDRMLRIQREVSAVCSDAGVALSSHVTTNGYLLDTTRARALCDAGLLSYQITMDGPPDVHNERRLLKGSGDSFERVFENLCGLASMEPKANIKLRVNFDPVTLQRVPELLQIIPRQLRGRIHLVLERIFGEGVLFIGSTVEKLARQTEEMYDLARSMGFAVTTTPLDPGKLTYCYADRENQFLFTHTGDVFKCTVGTFEEKDRLGALTDDGAIAWVGDGLADWMGVPAIDEECRSCTFLPMCMGGCRKNRHQRGHASADCMLPFAAMDVRVQQRYDVLLADHGT